MNTRWADDSSSVWKPIGLTDEEYAAMLRADTDARNRVRILTEAEQELEDDLRGTTFWTHLLDFLGRLFIFGLAILTAYALYFAVNIGR